MFGSELLNSCLIANFSVVTGVCDLLHCFGDVSTLHFACSGFGCTVRQRQILALVAWLEAVKLGVNGDHCFLDAAIDFFVFFFLVTWFVVAHWKHRLDQGEDAKHRSGLDLGILIMAGLVAFFLILFEVSADCTTEGLAAVAGDVVQGLDLVGEVDHLSKWVKFFDGVLNIGR